MISTYTTTLTSKKEIAPHIYKFRFSLDSELHFAAGQYLIFLIPHEGSTVRRLYSISSPDFHTKSFEIIVQIVEGGIASTRFAAMTPGESLTAQGPAGIFTLRDNPKPKIFLATGTGIAPMFSMIESRLTKEGMTAPRMMVFWGLRSRADAYHVDELYGLMAKHPQLSVRICLSRESADALAGEQDIYIAGRIDSILSTHVIAHPTIVHAVNDFEYYLCGSVPAVNSLTAILANAGANKENVFMEKFV